MLAKNVYEGVKQRMSQLQADVREREERLAALQTQLGNLALEHESALRQVRLEQQVSICCYRLAIVLIHESRQTVAACSACIGTGHDAVFSP